MKTIRKVNDKLYQNHSEILPKSNKNISSIDSSGEK